MKPDLDADRAPWGEYERGRSINCATKHSTPLSPLASADSGEGLKRSWLFIGR